MRWCRFPGDLTGPSKRSGEHRPLTASGAGGAAVSPGLRALRACTDLLATVPDYAACALIEGSSQLRADDPPFDIGCPSCPWSGTGSTITIRQTLVALANCPTHVAERAGALSELKSGSVSRRKIGMSVIGGMAGISSTSGSPRHGDNWRD